MPKSRGGAAATAAVAGKRKRGDHDADAPPSKQARGTSDDEHADDSSSSKQQPDGDNHMATEEPTTTTTTSSSSEQPAPTDDDKEELERKRREEDARLFEQSLLDQPWGEPEPETEGDGDGGAAASSTSATKDDGGDDDDEADFIAPIMDGRNITFQTRILNDYLVCALCTGYFREPYTIKECLHTFCKSCIYKHFQMTSKCPVCQTSLAPKPFEAIRYDRTLHELVNKIFPDIIAKDYEAMIEFYKKRGLPVEAQGELYTSVAKPEEPSNASSSHESADKSREAAEAEKERAKEKAKAIAYRDEIQFKLECDTREPTSDVGMRPLAKPIITTSARVTIRHLKKFLKMELGLSAMDLDDIELLYKDEPLGPEHTLEYILKTRGHDPREQAVFVYRKRKSVVPAF